MTQGSRSHVRGLVEVGLASILWGTGGLAVQLIRGQEDLSPVTISAWRMAVSAAVLVVGVRTAAYQGFYFVSVTEVGVAVSTVISLGLAPVLLTVAESVRHRRGPSPPGWSCWPPLLGLVLVSVAWHAAATCPAPVASVLLALASGTTYALTTVAGGSVSRMSSPLALTTAMTLVGAAVLLPCLAVVDGPRLLGEPVVTRGQPTSAY